MLISAVHVKNFRSILDDSLPCDRLTALVGRNGAGKSSLLRALELFYDPSAKVTTEDFYAEDTSQDIEIAVTFAELSTEEQDFFSAYIDNGTLTVVRVFSLAPGRKSGTYHGMRLQNPDFAEVRTAGGRREITNKYNELRSTEKYSSLPTVRSADEALSKLQEWESANPNACVRMRDDGQFFGFTEVGQGYLGRHTRFIRIPAVRDASEDAMERRGSCVTEIMDLVVRSALARRKDIATFKEETQAKYRDILDPAKLSELTGLQAQLSKTLKQYAPEADVSLRWAEFADINIPMPEAQVKLVEDGYESSVLRTGHGLQRAFILTMLQHLVAAREMKKTMEEGFDSKEQSSEAEEPYLPGLVLAIEEPELYQHPSRQRHLASVLVKLATGTIPGVAKKTQVIYSTHSPLFVGLDRFDQIRLLRKKDVGAGKPKVTEVVKANLEAVAEELWDACGRQGVKYTSETLRPRLQAIMTPWVNEGFFADVVVLVEGEDDRAAILGVARAMGYDFDSANISVIPCMGKPNLDRPLVIFRRLRIPVYVIWDSDYGERDPKPESNRYLLRLLGQAEEDWPNIVEDWYACFEVKLEATIAEEIGQELFNQLLSQAQNELGIPKKEHALKNPVVLQQIVEKAAAEGKESISLKGIVQKIIALKSRQEESNDPQRV
ncbi:ATP-dependent nuclease [Candidatus Desulforudis audaxviator]|uniref:ATP-dependent endonuclease, OLD family protein n=1 Tax=Desulforudis audaxviator (strain MP104C) TaxID=477974 RepID=B1I298_DESAP|nr:ATP-dependent endonuclease [Candidatus Desulforudis audaxviator]ACA59051.1 ATP-dependent endonuclease, OLD family protein [Candidatus Desulforudis audaxviator MP104C]AZK59095.1 putative ATP-dependent endonuclease, OLD family [Candidatus Desulforudis audaxviator]